MAKAKSKTPPKSKAPVKSKSKGKGKAATLPSGYKIIGRAPNWDIDKHPVIEGERGETRDVEFAPSAADIKKFGKKAQPRTVRTFVLQDAEIGAVTVWESGMLKDMFDQTAEGDILRIEFIGYGEIRVKGQNAPKLFQVSTPG